MTRETMAAGGRDLVDRLDEEAERRRALEAGELVLMPEALRPVPVAAPTDAREQVRQLWRWAAWACRDGIPPGWTAAERPGAES